MGSTLPRVLSVETYLAYTRPDLLDRPLAMAMNGVMLLLSIVMTVLYSVVMDRVSRKIGGIQ